MTYLALPAAPPPLFTNVDDYYTDKAFDLDGIVEDIRPLLAEMGVDTFVGVGISGCLVVPFLGHTFGKHYAVVRKQGDKHHSHFADDVVGSIGRRWAFVDDFVCEGKTRDRAVSVVASFAPAAVYAGTYSYHRGKWTSNKPNFWGL
jgi:orotate phosphoribosyltransferase-like protein